MLERQLDGVPDTTDLTIQAADVGERDILLSIGWQDEGIGWHGISR